MTTNTNINEMIASLNSIDTFNCSDALRSFVVVEKSKLYQELAVINPHYNQEESQVVIGEDYDCYSDDTINGEEMTRQVA